MILMIGLTACKKSGTNGDQQAADPMIIALADQALSEMDNQEAYAGTPETGICMDNGGISPAFLADDSDLSGDDAMRPEIRKHSFIRCLKTLQMSETQIGQVKSLLRDYKVCNAEAVKRAMAIYRELHATYKEKYYRIWQAFQAGTITEREFKKRAEELRIAFKRELRSLQLKEKLGIAFARCFKDFLGDLKPVLTERQWNAFTQCIRRKV